MGRPKKTEQLQQGKEEDVSLKQILSPFIQWAFTADEVAAEIMIERYKRHLEKEAKK